ncbi:MAG: ABC transporter permease [Gammaproteobacteria bacterium]|nr:ABC transporter permease [Gammaproteobacteria bacterium]MCP4475673.1 ABC transporter permease [Gammaproteobacteria bacterium]
MRATIMVNKEIQIFSASSDWTLGWQDICQGFQYWRIWLMLSWQDICMRYRRSVLGPLWITASTAIMIYSMGFLYSHLLAHAELKSYFPVLASGIVTWQLISMIIKDANSCLIEANTLLLNQKLPYTLFLFRIIIRNLIIFLHNLLAVIPAVIIFKVPINGASLFLFFSLLLVFINGYLYGALLFMLGSRYRDTQQLVESLIQVAFFLTPVIWDPSRLSQKYQFILYFNPFAQFVQLCRMPMLGQIPPFHTIVITLLLTLLGIILMVPLFCKCRRHIIYWL